MSQARALLDAGRAALRQEYAITFTVDGYSRTFIGNCDELRYSNQLGSGGFTFDADAILGVELAEFAMVGLTPTPGMRLRVYGLDCRVARVGKNDQRWSLTLEAAQTETG